MMSKHLRALALLTALLFAASGCAGQSADAQGEVPFTAGAYPVDAAAPCEVDEFGEPKPGLARIDAPDDTTVVFTLCAPDPSFLQKLSIVSYGINDSGYLAAATADGSILTAPNGTGPLRLINWSIDREEVILGRHEGYWGEKAISDRVIVKWQSDSAARLVQLKAGVVDGIDNVAANDIPPLQLDGDYQVFTRPPVTTLIAAFNNTMKPFDDVRVRQALAMTIDSRRLVENFFPIGSAPATHYVPCIIQYGCEGQAWWVNDLARAKQLLSLAGYPNGFSTKIVFRDAPRVSNPDPIGIATDLQDQLSQIGIIATLEVQEPTSFDANVLAGTIDGIFIIGWTPDYLDPINYMYRYLVGDSSQFGEIGDEIKAPIRQASILPNSAARAQLFAAANEAIREQAVFIPLGHGSSAVAWSREVSGAHSSPIADEDFSRVAVPGKDQIVFLQNVEPASLYCADESQNYTLRLCSQIHEGLYAVKSEGVDPVPALATECAVSESLLQWTCSLRSGVKFHNGAQFDAGDVRDSLAAMWDCANPLHVGRTGGFEYWSFLSSFLNQNRCGE